MYTVIERIKHFAETNPDKLALVYESGSVTYKQLWDKSLSIACILKNRGVQKGDSVLVQASYNTFHAALCYACHILGAVFVPAESSPAPGALEAVAKRVNAAVIVSSRIIPGCNCLSFEEVSAMHVIEDAFSYTLPSLDDVADIMFTTGTTGTPKGVVLSHRNIAATSVTRIKALKLKEDNFGITLVPLNHVAAMRQLYLNGYNGSTMVFLDGISKMKIMFEYMKEYPVNMMYIPPSMIGIMTALSGGRLSEFSDKIRIVYTGSAPMQNAQKEYMKEMLPSSRLYYSYGSSENGTVCLLNYDTITKPITCVGKPCPGVTVRIVDSSMNDVPDGEYGTIVIKSEMNTPGYLDNPELNAISFKEGFFITNDVGYFDSDGCLYIAGRKDDVINIGGLKVYPSEIENAALSVDSIAECICFPCEDKIFGKCPKLLVKLKEGTELSVKELRTVLSSKLDTYKLPKTIEYTGEIHKTANGKPDRKYYMSAEKM